MSSSTSDHRSQPTGEGDSGAREPAPDAEVAGFAGSGERAMEAAPPVSDDPAVEPPPDAGTMPQVEGYQLVALLGQGGMGTVWRGRQLSTHREVAIKFLRGGAFGSGTARRRFEREVELAGQLQHPHITRLYHSGVHQGAYFYAMEMVDGQPLTDHVATHRLGRREMLMLFQKVCQAVGYAHHRGVIHRDLKPSNILVDAEGEPRLLDFGLARDLADGRQTTLSQDGAAVGTLAYMAPEQAAGQRARVDTRTDVYSLGVILFELLTGGLPHGPADSDFELQRRIVEQEPPSPRSIDRTIDHELNAIVHKALSHGMEARYANAADFAADIGNYLNREPVRARPLTLGYLLRKRIAKHRQRFALALLLGGLMIGALGYAYGQVRIERDRAQRDAKAAERSLYLTQIALARKALDEGAVSQAQDVLDSALPRMRQWEWHRLRYEADQSVHVFEGHADAVWPIAIADDRVVSLDRTGTLRQWSLASGEEHTLLDTLPGSSMRALSADGNVVAFGTDETIEVYSAQFGHKIDSLETPDGAPRQITISRTGHIVAALTDGVLAVWHRTAEDNRREEYELDTIHRLRIGAEDRLAYTSGDEVWTLHLETGERTQVGEVSQRPRALAWSDDGRMLAAADTAGRVMIWPLKGDSSQEPQVIDVGSRVRTIAFDSDSARLAMGMDDGTIALWDRASAAKKGEYRGHRDRVSALVFGSDGSTLVSASPDTTVRAWEIGRSAEGREDLAFDGTAPVTALDFDPELDVLVAGDAGGTLSVYGPHGSGRKTLEQSAFPVRSLALAGTRQWLGADLGGSLAVWRTDEWSHVGVVSIESPHTTALAWLPERDALASTSYVGDDLSVSLWTVSEHGLTKEGALPGSRDIVAVQNSTRLLTISPDRNEVLLLCTADQAVVAALPVLHPPARELAVTGDGRLLAVLGDDNWICLWALGDRTHQQTFQAATVHDLAFIPGTDRLVTAGEGLAVWDVQAGVRLVALESASARFHSVAFDPETGRIMGGGNGFVRIWHTGRGEARAPDPSQ